MKVPSGWMRNHFLTLWIRLLSLKYLLLLITVRWWTVKDWFLILLRSSLFNLRRSLPWDHWNIRLFMHFTWILNSTWLIYHCRLVAYWSRHSWRLWMSWWMLWLDLCSGLVPFYNCQWCHWLFIWIDSMFLKRGKMSVHVVLFTRVQFRKWFQILSWFSSQTIIGSWWYLNQMFKNIFEMCKVFWNIYYVIVFA